MRRIMVYSRTGAAMGEINPNDVLAATLREEINGEHSLEITTTQVLDKGVRLLHQDGRGVWREFAVVGVDAEHASGNSPIGTYYCPWSIQEDLSGVTVSVMPGTQTPVMASVALQSLLSSQERWTRGTVTNTATGGASMYDRSAWEALSTLVDVWGGEVDVTIGVSTITGVITRSVDLYSRQGNQTAKRRFDFGADAKGITRTYEDAPLICRISPRGKGEETDAGGYGRKITIESVNSGKDYLEYSPMVNAARLSNGASGYLYPTKIVENSDCETPADLKTWAQSVLAEECTPKISYELDVLQSDEAGTSVQGVSLGDAVQVVDRKFGDGLRVEARVTSIVTDLVAERVESVELGAQKETMAAQFTKYDKAVAQLANQMTVMATPEYVSSLLDRINAEVNATGGYTYITEGQGLRTYDVAVSDPLIGAEASQVVEIKGGNIRIANSKTAQGEWEWKTVLQSGHILADLVTAAKLTSGFIGSADSGNYWDLDTGEFRMAQTAMLGNKSVSQVLSDVSGANEIAFEALDENLIPFTDAVDSDHGWLFSTGASGNGALQVLLTAQASGLRSARSPSIPYYLVRERDAMLSLDAVAGTAGTTLSVTLELWHKGDTARYGRIERTLTLTASTTRYELGITFNDADFTLTSGEAIAATDELRVGFWNSTANVGIRVARVKLQLGTLASSWRPSSAQPAADAAVEAQTQEYVFNKLTANGTLQGLYMSNGDLYVNASYIKTGVLSANLITAGSMSAERITSGTMSAARINGGTLKMGGSANGNGVIAVYDDSDALAARLDNYGFRLYHSASYSTLLQAKTYNNVNYASITNTSPNSSTARLHVGGYIGGELTVGSYTRGSDYYSTINTSTSTIIGTLRTGADVKVGPDQWNKPNIGGVVYCYDVRASGSKSRLVTTEHYDDRLLYCYETPNPYFGDIGSGKLDESGVCYIEIDDVFAETVNTTTAYQVFLQKCGHGDLWVVDKTPTHFVVEGTPNLSFDWEIKCRQRDYEQTRIEQCGVEIGALDDSSELPNPEDAYTDYIEEIEQALAA